jgi:GNAT superfamily N-acetyltransferase
MRYTVLMPQFLGYFRDWLETFELPDGTRVLLRPLRPSDKALLQTGMRKLSNHSVRQRFLGARSSLSVDELRYLTEVDGEDHWAICAVLERDPTVGIATARFIRLAKGGDEAEIAITVIDEYQRRGLGKRLFRHLVAAATERGIRKFHVIAAHDNVAMRKLAAGLTDVHSRTSELGVMTLIASPARAPAALASSV